MIFLLGIDIQFEIPSSNVVFPTKPTYMVWIRVGFARTVLHLTMYLVETEGGTNLTNGIILELNGNAALSLSNSQNYGRQQKGN